MNSNTTKVRTRSGVVHYGEKAARWTVMPDCGPRGRQTVGEVVAHDAEVTCKACLRMAGAL